MAIYKGFGNKAVNSFLFSHKEMILIPYNEQKNNLKSLLYKKQAVEEVSDKVKTEDEESRLKGIDAELEVLKSKIVYGLEKAEKPEHYETVNRLVDEYFDLKKQRATYNLDKDPSKKEDDV